MNTFIECYKCIIIHLLQLFSSFLELLFSSFIWPFNRCCSCSYSCFLVFLCRRTQDIKAITPSRPLWWVMMHFLPFSPLLLLVPALASVGNVDSHALCRRTVVAATSVPSARGSSTSWWQCLTATTSPRSLNWTRPRCRRPTRLCPGGENKTLCVHTHSLASCRKQSDASCLVVLLYCLWCYCSVCSQHGVL